MEVPLGDIYKDRWFQQPPYGPCPTCGHCPTCGRQSYPSYPKVWWNTNTNVVNATDGTNVQG